MKDGEEWSSWMALQALVKNACVLQIGSHWGLRAECCGLDHVFKRPIWLQVESGLQVVEHGMRVPGKRLFWGPPSSRNGR